MVYPTNVFLSETNFMVFNKYKISRITIIHITNHQIETTDYVRFLEARIDSLLTYKLYFNQIKNYL